MFNENNKLPEVKRLLEVNRDFQPIINFISLGHYSGSITDYIDYMEDLYGRYNGDILFKDSDLLPRINDFAEGLSSCINDYISMISVEKQKTFIVAANEIVLEYNRVMGKYMK